MKGKLAQYFTPEPVARFAVEALIALGLRGSRLRAVDPACGDGVFLRAVARRFPQAELWGCDVDPSLEPRWRRSGLPGERVHLFVQDGLTDAPLWGLGAGQFDLVVGNPPYGFGVPRPRGRERIEEHFLRRFVELARPGGWLGTVLPEGIAANARCQRLRDWALERAALRAVVALPEATFAASGTRARTAVVLARKGEATGEDVLLAEPTDHNGQDVQAYLDEVLSTLEGGAGDVPAGGGGR